VEKPLVRIAQKIDKAFFEPLDELEYSRLGLVIDENVHHHHYKRLKKYLPDHTVFKVRAGEQHKNIATCEKIWRYFYDRGFDRQALVLVIGGGVTTDMGGYAAECWKRGLRYVLMPTTLLGMVDAAVGGKFGVDFRDGKNLIGLFGEPMAIWMATDFLNTLPERDLKAGYAEVLKHGLISDRIFWEKCSTKFPNIEKYEEVEGLLWRSIELKQEVVDIDPLERGLRKILNFGHTIGHALESLYLKTETPLLHGEAVAIGMVLEARLSAEHTGLKRTDARMIEERLEALGFELWPAKVEWDTMEELLLQDKKAKSGELRFTLLENIGNARVDVPIPLDAVKDVCKRLLK
jgi:3-dehydroquinate synthase